MEYSLFLFSSNKLFVTTNLALVVGINSTIVVALGADPTLPQITSGAEFGVTRVTLTRVTTVCVGAGVLAGSLSGTFVHIYKIKKKLQSHFDPYSQRIKLLVLL